MAYMGFSKLSAKLKGKAKNPKGLAAAIGRAKYGKRKFQKAAAKGQSLKGAGPAPGYKGLAKNKKRRVPEYKGGK